MAIKQSTNPTAACLICDLSRFGGLWSWSSSWRGHGEEINSCVLLRNGRRNFLLLVRMEMVSRMSCVLDLGQYCKFDGHVVSKRF